MKGKDKSKRREGWQRRQCGKTIPQKFETIQKIRTAVSEAGHGETEIPHKFWVALMRKEYSWMKQVRPLKELWGKRDQVEADYRTLVISNGIAGGRKQGSSKALCKAMVRGANKNWR